MRPDRTVRIAERAASGLSLPELLVAIAIVAIVSAIAGPAYTRYSVRTYETEAQADLLRCASGMERHAATTFTYAGAVGPGADSGEVTPNICEPRSDRYGFEVVHADTVTFELRATPLAGTPVAARPPLAVDAGGVVRAASTDP
jgi:type IV pilus assembly protein PilE